MFTLGAGLLPRTRHCVASSTHFDAVFESRFSESRICPVLRAEHLKSSSRAGHVLAEDVFPVFSLLLDFAPLLRRAAAAANCTLGSGGGAERGGPEAMRPPPATHVSQAQLPSRAPAACGATALASTGATLASAEGDRSRDALGVEPSVRCRV